MRNPQRQVVVGIGLACCATLAMAIVMSAMAHLPVRRDDNVQDIPEETIKKMIKEAQTASKNAYCDYSKFPVGAAVLADDGAVFAGCNVENASYGMTICAERNAVFQMVAKGKKRIKAVVIYTPTQKPAAPCGACRQVINEFGPDALVISVCDGPVVLRKKLSELLPDAFGPANVK